MLKRFRLKFIHILGGFPDALSAIEAEPNEEERRKILNLAVKKLYNTIGAEDILRVKDGEWVFLGKALPPGVKEGLIKEAAQLLDSKLWEVLQADIKYQANKLMFTRSQTDLDLAVGKVWTFTLDAMKTRLKSMQKGSGMFNVNRKG